MSPLRRLLQKLDADTPPEEQWLREGWPRALPLLIVAILPALVAAPIRYYTGIALPIAFGLGLVIVVLLALPFRRAFSAWRPRADVRSVTAYGVSLALAAVSIALVHNGDFAGLPTYQGADGNVAIDAATHVLSSVQFATSKPDVYAGCSALYAFWNAILVVTRGDYVLAANVSFLAGAVVIAGAPCVLGFALLRRVQSAAFFTGAAVLLGGGLLVGWFVILPLEAFHVVGGFWTHLFGLIPLFAIWFTDALVRARVLRVALMLFLAILYRHTYALDVPELLATLAVLLVIEAAGLRSSRVVRVAAVMAALALLGLSRYAFRQLVPLTIGSTGWIVSHDMAAVWRGQLACVGALAAAMAFFPARDAARESGIVRTLRFPALFVLGNAIAFALLRAQPGGEHAYSTVWANYYFQKHSLHAAVLGASALVVLAAFCAATAVERHGWRTLAAASLPLALALGGHLQLQQGFAVYRDVLTEVAFGMPPYPRLRPWVDVDALRLMKSQLRSAAAKHGGFSAAYYPLAAFMNATFGHGSPPFWRPQPIEASAGHCVFWEGGKVPSADRDPSRSCSSYHARWEPQGTQRWLCSRCY